MSLTINQRIRISIFNLLIVALAGVLMRYKIGFEFPLFSQKNLQHAHSHFAFFGWLTHTLMTLIAYYHEKNILNFNTKKYNLLIIGNLICAYGMLISFALGGYNAISISFSSLSIIISYIFTVSYVKETRINNKSQISTKWFTAALFFNALASIGTFTLAYIMARHHIHLNLYLSSVYFYLHFQYNGWFLFATLGLVHLYFKNNIDGYLGNRKAFWMLAISCIPAYLLSTLWMNLPNWLYIIVIVASITQFIAWLLLLRNFVKNYSNLKNKPNNLIKYTFALLAIALTVKFLLQLASVIPVVSNLAFGFRPIVIAYLHLILLAIISVFLLTYLMANNFISNSKSSHIGITTLIIGIYLTEIALAVQGIASLSYIIVPYINELLFSLSILISLGIAIILFSKKNN